MNTLGQAGSLLRRFGFPENHSSFISSAAQSFCLQQREQAGTTGWYRHLAFLLGSKLAVKPAQRSLLHKTTFYTTNKRDSLEKSGEPLELSGDCANYSWLEVPMSTIAYTSLYPGGLAYWQGNCRMYLTYHPNPFQSQTTGANRINRSFLPASGLLTWGHFSAEGQCPGDFTPAWLRWLTKIT